MDFFIFIDIPAYEGLRVRKSVLTNYLLRTICKWLIKTPKYKLKIFYFFKLSEKFDQKNRSYKVFSNKKR